MWLWSPSRCLRIAGDLMRIAVRTVLCLALVLVPACEPRRCARRPTSPVKTYSSAALREVRVIGIVPFAKGAATEDVAATVGELFASELQQAATARVVVIRDDVGHMIAPPGLQPGGQPTIDGLIRARRELGLDAVMLGEITQYRPYGSPVIGLEVRAISCKTGDTEWIGTGVFDSSSPEVADLFRWYCFTQRAEDLPLSTERQLLTSPRSYAQFVAHFVAAAFTTQ